jgi:hypothetical protein
VFTGFATRPEAADAGKKKPPAFAGGLTKEGTLAADYGEYVIVRTPATPVIVIVVPWENPKG